MKRFILTSLIAVFFFAAMFLIVTSFNYVFRTVREVTRLTYSLGLLGSGLRLVFFIIIIVLIVFILIYKKKYDTNPQMNRKKEKSSPYLLIGVLVVFLLFALNVVGSLKDFMRPPVTVNEPCRIVRHKSSGRHADRNYRYVMECESGLKFNLSIFETINNIDDKVRYNPSYEDFYWDRGYYETTIEYYPGSRTRKSTVINE